MDGDLRGRGGYSGRVGLPVAVATGGVLGCIPHGVVAGDIAELQLVVVAVGGVGDADTEHVGIGRHIQYRREGVLVVVVGTAVRAEAQRGAVVNAGEAHAVVTTHVGGVVADKVPAAHAVLKVFDIGQLHDAAGGMDVEGDAGGDIIAADSLYAEGVACVGSQVGGNVVCKICERGSVFGGAVVQ